MTSLEGHRNPITLTRFIIHKQHQLGESTGEFSLMLQSVQLACKIISNACNKAGIANLYGVDGSSNASGDVVKKLDVFSNDVFINCMSFSEEIYIMCSEENEEAIIPKGPKRKGGYAIVFDPLDGSSNIDANVSVGTIFGIYKKDEMDDSEPSDKDLLRPGTELVAAGYALYGAATMIVLTTGDGVNGFLLDPSLGEFILTHEDIKIPSSGNIYSINEGNAAMWDAPTSAFIEYCKRPGSGAKAKKARYIGSMVGDVHRTLLYGGIFCYPGNPTHPTGKLRLLYEANPMSFLIEQAGGRSTTGIQRIMEIQPTKLHQRVPVFMGSTEDVLLVEKLHKTGGRMSMARL